MEKMKIEIWSDIACPYCYIGKRKLENALKEFKHSGNIELIWHSYELNPNLPDKPMGISYYEYISGMQGINIDEAKENLQDLVDLAKSVDLEFNYDKLVVANTSNALRLVKFAKTYNLATETEEVLFKAYFTDGNNINDKSTLISLGKQVGLPEPEIEVLLNSKTFVDEIEKDIRYSEDILNLEYIPFYLFNNKTIIQGSVSENDYLEVLSKSYDEWKKNGVSDKTDNDIVSGQSCSIDGKCS